jgi:hypothetical protein
VVTSIDNEGNFLTTGVSPSRLSSQLPRVG